MPEAKLHLKLAQDQYDQAKKLVADGENNRAALVLMRAEADAELAHALAREYNLKVEAKQAEEKLRSIQQ